MSMDHARKFVEKMREEKIFRKLVVDTETQEELLLVLREEQLHFDFKDLAGAMAECMDQLEKEMVNP